MYVKDKWELHCFYPYGSNNGGIIYLIKGNVHIIECTVLTMQTLKHFSMLKILLYYTCSIKNLVYGKFSEIFLQSMSGSGLHLKKKNVTSLVQKWQKVKKEVEIEERNREEREQAIRQKLEEWKQEYSW